MDTNSYIAFLVLGAVLVAIDGQIIYRSGRRYLEHSYGDPEAGASMTRLVTVLFHLAVLGVLMLISTISVGGTPTEGVVTRLGIVLLLLAVAHGLTIAILTRIRDRQLQERLADEMAGHPAKPEQTVVEPRPDSTPPYLTP
jgi:drug/metabolite transporter (DMT)-like permease